MRLYRVTHLDALGILILKMCHSANRLIKLEGIYMDHQSPAPDPAEGNPKNHIMKVMVHGDEIEFFLFVR